MNRRGHWTIIFILTLLSFIIAVVTLVIQLRTMPPAQERVIEQYTFTADKLPDANLCRSYGAGTLPPAAGDQIDTLCAARNATFGHGDCDKNNTLTLLCTRVRA